MNDSSKAQLAYGFLAPESQATMISVRRKFRMAYMRALAAPFSGSYYWIPLPGAKWELVGFSDRFYSGNSSHAKVWPEIVNILALNWGKEPEILESQLQTSRYGLPRGRVIRIENGLWGIAHGNDTPRGVSLELVRTEFSLLPGTREFDDCQYAINSEHLRVLRDALKEPPILDLGSGQSG